MKVSTFSGLTALAALASLTAAIEQTAAIYIQAVSQSPSAPELIAEVKFDIATPSKAEVVSFEFPDIPEGAKTVRVGIYNPSTKQWESSTSVASVANFDKGYSPTMMLSVDQKGRVVSVACRGVIIDAGATRDFGPQALVLVSEKGKQPDLNKPVVLTPDGKKPVQEEKTLFQKYWWLIAVVVLLTMTGGGGEGK